MPVPYLTTQNFFAQIMEKIKKVSNLRIISVLMILLFIFTNTLYSFPTPKDSLRVPIGQKNVYRRLDKMNRRTILKRGAVVGTGIVITGGLVLKSAMDDIKIKDRCLNDRRRLREKIEELDVKYGLQYESSLYTLNKMLEYDEYFEVIKDYLEKNGDNKYSFLVVFDVLDLIREVDYKRGEYKTTLLTSLGLGNGIKHVFGRKYSKSGEYLLIKILLSELVDKDTKMDILRGSIDREYYNSQLYVKTLKALIYAGNRELQEAIIEHLNWGIFYSHSEIALNILKDIIMDTNNKAVDDILIREIVEALYFVHTLNLSKNSGAYSPIFAGSILKFGSLNLQLLGKDSIFLVIKTLREMKILSLNNKWAKIMHDFIFTPEPDTEIVLTSDIDYSDTLGVRYEDDWGTQYNIDDLPGVKQGVKERLHREMRERGYLVVLRFENFFETERHYYGETYSKEIPKGLQEIAIDYILNILLHELDHVRTAELDRNKAVYDTNLQKFVNEKHAYLVASDVIREIRNRYHSFFARKYWQKLLKRFDRDFLPDEHGMSGGFFFPSAKYKDLSRLEEHIIDKRKLNAKEIIRRISEADKGGGIYSGSDMEFQYNSWVYPGRERSGIIGKIGTFLIGIQARRGI